MAKERRAKGEGALQAEPRTQHRTRFLFPAFCKPGCFSVGYGTLVIKVFNRQSCPRFMRGSCPRPRQKRVRIQANNLGGGQAVARGREGHAHMCNTLTLSTFGVTSFRFCSHGVLLLWHKLLLNSENGWPVVFTI